LISAQNENHGKFEVVVGLWYTYDNDDGDDDDDGNKPKLKMNFRDTFCNG